MASACGACGAQLADGLPFCMNCGTANTPAEPETTIITSAPPGVELATGRSRDDRRRRRATAKITRVGHRGGSRLEGADRAHAPEAIPWETLGDSGSRVTTLPIVPAGKLSNLLAIVSGVSLAFGVILFSLANVVGSASSAQSILASLKNENNVAVGLSRTVVDTLVGEGHVEPETREAGVSSLTALLDSDESNDIWSQMLEGSYQSGSASEPGANSPGITLDVTPLVDDLRYSGIAQPDATVEPLVLHPSSRAEPISSFASTVGLVSGALLVVGAAGLVTAIWVSRFRATTAVLLGISTGASAPVAFGVAWLILRQTLGSPDQGELQPLVDGIISRLSGHLMPYLVATMLVGVLAVIAGWWARRSRTPVMSG